MFPALVVDEVDGALRVAVRDADEAELPEGDVTLDVEYSTLNYKDALAIVNGKPVVRSFPMVPGVDCAGTVAESSSPDWNVGDAVVMSGWGMGEERWGGLAQRARVDGAWLTAVPDGWTARDAMVVGTAGVTAALASAVIERAVAAPGPVVVTGASGGVGSFAVMLLAAAGYDVLAATTTPDAVGLPHRPRRARDRRQPRDRHRRAGAGQATLGGRDRQRRRLGARRRHRVHRAPTAPSSPAGTPAGWTSPRRSHRSSCGRCALQGLQAVKVPAPTTDGTRGTCSPTASRARAWPRWPRRSRSATRSRRRAASWRTR